MVNTLIKFYQYETDGPYFQHFDMELELVFQPQTMKGKENSLFQMSSLID